MAPETIARKIFLEAISALQPDRLLERLTIPALTARPLSAYRRIAVIGIGKSALPWATVLHERVTAESGRPPAETIAAVPRGYTSGLPERYRLPQSLEVLSGGHPVPDRESVRAARRIAAVARALSADDLLLLAVSGGATAACNDFAAGITITDAVRAYEVLLEAGLDIHAMNVVRKHLSTFNGGRLARAAYPAEVVALITSDVPGDDLSVVAGGPVSPDPSTFADAWRVVSEAELVGEMPASVTAHLRAGVEGRVEGRAGEGDPVFSRVRTVLAASNDDARKAAASEAVRLGFEPLLRERLVTGEAREAGRDLIHEAAALPDRRICYVAGGETTVTVRGKGTGGRNQELAVGAGMEIERMDRRDLLLLSAGTDGIDGPTDAAGAVISAAHVRRARALGRTPEAALRDNDTHAFCKAADALVTTGPTHVNVMDLQLVLIGID